MAVRSQTTLKERPDRHLGLDDIVLRPRPTLRRDPFEPVLHEDMLQVEEIPSPPRLNRRSPLELIPAPEENDLAKETLEWTAFGAKMSATGAFATIFSVVLTIIISREELKKWFLEVLPTVLQVIGIVLNIFIIVAPIVTVIFLIFKAVEAFLSMSTTHKIVTTCIISMLTIYVLSQSNKPTYISRWSANPMTPPPEISIQPVIAPLIAPQAGQNKP